MTGEIRGFLASAIAEGAPGDTEDFFDLGYVDSLFALELVTYVERQFQLTVEVADLDLDNFRTIARIAGFVLRKWAAQDSASGPGQRG